MLSASNFSCIGQDGLGNPRSRVAHCLAWFQDRLFVGVTHPKGSGPTDCARILSWSPETGEWKKVFESPLRQADARADAQDILRSRQSGPAVTDLVPHYRGFRAMAVFQGKSDPHPCLYVSTICHWGAEILRSEDGQNFEVVTEPGLGDRNLLSFRVMFSHGGKLFVAPTGRVEDSGRMDRNFSGDCRLFCTDDPRRGNWQAATPPGMGDPNNTTLTQGISFAGQLYVGTGNPERGFQIWRSDLSGAPPFHWEPVIIDGAGRYALNETAISMAVLGEYLYVGSGLPGLGYDKANDVGPAAAEIIRIGADGRWDLVVGSPRFSPDGLKVPLSAFGPGFDDFYNSAFWVMATHADTLYVGTHHWQPFESVRARTFPVGGCELWASQDGENFLPVFKGGLDDSYEIGIRTLLSTPVGLFAGSSNHQEIARLGRQAMAGAGGCHVWLGR